MNQLKMNSLVLGLILFHLLQFQSINMFALPGKFQFELSQVSKSI